MAAPDETSLSGETSPAGEASLGRDVGRRLRFPGPRTGRRRTGSIGMLASATTRFAAGAARPVVVRRALAATDAIRVGSTGGSAVAPPRWWTPDEHAGAAVSAARLPPR